MNSDTSLLKNIRMCNDKIVEVTYADNIKLTLSGIADVFNKLYEVTENKRVGRLLIIGNETIITNAGRLAIAEENRQKRDLIIAEAIVLNSFYQKISANFYMRFTKRKFPVQCFTEIEIAREWLEKKVKKS